MKNSLRNRLILSQIGFAIVPLLTLGLLLSWYTKRIETEQIKAFQEELSLQISSNIAMFLHEQEHKIFTLVRSYDLPTLPTDTQQELLAKFLATSKDTEHGFVFDDIALLDPRGKQLALVSRLHPKSSGLTSHLAAPEEIFRDPARKISYSPDHFSEETGEPIMEMRVPIRDLQTQQLTGILIAEMKLNFLWRYISSLRIGKTGTAFITDLNGRVVVHPNRSIVLKNTQFDVPSQPAVMQNLAGEETFVTTRKILFGDQPMFLVTEIPTTEAFGHLHTSILLIALLLFIALAGAVLLAALTVHQIVRPVEALAHAAKKIKDGDFNQLVPVEQNDELGELSTAFNSMSARLHETISYLEAQISFVENTLESLSHPFYVIDANDYTVKLANSAAHFGNIDQGKKCYELTHHAEEPCGGPDHPCTIKEIKKTGKPVVFEHNHCFGETMRNFEVYGYPIFDEKGEIIQVIEYNIDVTDKKNLEDQLRQAQKLEAIGSLASGIAHDFNNLLTTILGYGELTLMQMPETDPLRERIEAIHQAGIKASALTRQLLAFSRKQVLEMHVVNVNTLISEMTKMLKRLIGERVEVKMLLNPTAGNIMADPGQIEQIVMNLVINARDAMPEGGRLTIETDTIELDEKYCQSHVEISPGHYVVFCITDTGHGMTPEIMARIFDPFFTTKEKGTGTGLGLATVFGIVRQHNGNIYVYSELGCGTTFKIYFPEVRQEAEKITSQEIHGLPHGSEAILVVDDEPSIRHMVTDTLQPLGYSIYEAGSGEEALEIYAGQAGKFDLLLTDVIMPKMTGRELAEKIQSRDPGIKVLYMSGYTDNVIAYQGVLKPGIEFINKPLVPSLLTKKIRQVLDKEAR